MNIHIPPIMQNYLPLGVNLCVLRNNVFNESDPSKDNTLELDVG